MNPTAKRQRLLAGVLAVLVVVAVLMNLGDDAPAESPSPPSNRTGRAANAPVRSEPVGDVKLELLERAASALPAAERNPFQFRATAPPPQAPRVAARPAPQVEEIPQPPPGPPPPPPLPPIPLRFFGLTVVQGARIATFSDGRNNVFHGKEGDIIEGRYRVLRIGPESVELAYLDGRGRQTIRLSGQ